MPKEVDECVTALLRDNPEMDRNEAWAICYAQYNEEHNKMSHNLLNKCIQTFNKYSNILKNN